MDVRTATLSVSVKVGNVPFSFSIKMLKKVMSRMLNRMKMSIMPKIQMRAKMIVGRLMHSNNANPSLLALPLTVKRKT